MGPLLFLLYTSELFSILENKLIGYADDSTLMAVVPRVNGLKEAYSPKLLEPTSSRWGGRECGEGVGKVQRYGNGMYQ